MCILSIFTFSMVVYWFDSNRESKDLSRKIGMYRGLSLFIALGLGKIQVISET
jgi:hypothetical protein